MPLGARLLGGAALGASRRAAGGGASASSRARAGRGVGPTSARAASPLASRSGAVADLAQNAPTPRVETFGSLDAQGSGSWTRRFAAVPRSRRATVGPAAQRDEASVARPGLRSTRACARLFSGSAAAAAGTSPRPSPAFGHFAAALWPDASPRPGVASLSASSSSPPPEARAAPVPSSPSTSELHAAPASPSDTIFAPSTPSGRGAIAIVRVSGPLADEALAALLQGGRGADAAVASGPSRRRALPPPRVLARASLRDPRSRELLDESMAVRFPGPRSFSGEDVVELHVHGSPATVRGVLEALGALPGLRPAEPGEFSRRAFANGRMDLSGVEGLADLLAAETPAQRRAALAAASGDVARVARGWRRRLLEGLARVEAVLDYGDDEEIADEVAREAIGDLATLARDLEAELAASRCGELRREGARVALVGAPNAGKSSVLNRLAGRDAAIVSAFPGTTRDVLQVAVEAGGFKALVADTAGLRDANDPIEREGIRRAKLAASEADVVVRVWDAKQLAEEGIECGDGDGNGARKRGRVEGGPKTGEGPGGDGPSARAGAGPALCPDVDASASTLHVLNKSDLLSDEEKRRVLGLFAAENGKADPVCSGANPLAAAVRGGTGPLAERSRRHCSPVLLSCETGEGFGAFVDRLGRAIQAVADASGGAADPAAEAYGGTAGSAAVRSTAPSPLELETGSPLRRGDVAARGRRRAAVARAAEALRRAEGLVADLELAAEELRLAARELGSVTGEVDTEDVLDKLFGEFCIGK